jgi:tetratricopeptide (TPR) repeat protein
MGTAAIFALALLLRLFHLHEIELNDPFFLEFASDVRSGLIANCVLGALSCALLVVVGRQIFDRRVALIAGALFAVDSNSIFYSGMPVAANVLVPVVLGLVAQWKWAAKSDSRSPWIGVGAALGICIFLRPALILFAPLVWVCPSYPIAASGTRKTARAARLAVGLAIVILPLAAIQFTGAGKVAPLDAEAGISFYVGSHPNGSGGYGMPRVYPRIVADAPMERRALFAAVAEQSGVDVREPSAMSAFWFREGITFIATHPVRWLQLEAHKFGLFWNAVDQWQERSPNAERAFSWVRRLPLVTFGIAAPFALLGLVLTARDARRFYILYTVVAVHLAGSLIFVVLSRDRLPAVPVLLLFASFAGCWLWDQLRRRRVFACAMGLIALGGAFYFVHRPIHRENLAMAYYRIGDRFAQLDDWDTAIEYFGRSLNRDPGAVSTWSNLALAYEARGDSRQDAAHTWLRVLDLARRDEYHLHADRAEEHLRALGIEPLIAPPGAH